MLSKKCVLRKRWPPNPAVEETGEDRYADPVLALPLTVSQLIASIRCVAKSSG